MSSKQEANKNLGIQHAQAKAYSWVVKIPSRNAAILSSIGVEGLLLAAGPLLRSGLALRGLKHIIVQKLNYKSVFTFIHTTILEKVPASHNFEDCM